MIGRTTTQQFAAPGFDKLEYTKAEPGFGKDVTSASGQFTFSDFLNLFLFSEKLDIGVVIRALQSKGYFQSLAEPNLIAYNGQEASFLAGGEFPVPIVQGVTQRGHHHVQGVRRPAELQADDRRRHDPPEGATGSQLARLRNGITLSGFRIPALITRRAETDVELRDGQSFAIAGLLNNLSQDDAANIPFLSSMPIIGNLFKSKADRAERTELMVLITPRLVRPLNPDEVPPLPTQMKKFLPALDAVGQELSGGGGPVDAPAKTQNPAPKAK